ncbi:uncharacterized protein LOC117318797 [Pecten maximus]|uniref:uncharacterized protein LOC117318797 n=1 Tax=Pecten maximus TaxID=6579 RepID=UPI001458A043|nr:uncharacterized protein LOC117318797 [Pecten maximus]
MARRAGSVFTVLVIIWLSELPGIQMSVNLKDQLILSSTTASNPNYPLSGTTDGNYGPPSWGICMGSDPDNPVFWRGTFTGLARIQRIDIVFRDPDRADGYQFWISNVTDVPSGIKCYEDVDEGYPNIIQNITSCNITGKTLMIYITRPPGNNAFMDVCEVDVYGCFSNKYGDQCQNNCNCKHGCDPDNGVCDSPYCNAGWSGSTFCDQPCSHVTFGENCLQRCHCKTSGCNRQNGICLIPGCQAGYSGASCSQECVVPYFGNNCASQCRCRTHGCNHIDGTCTVPGCQTGWIGPSCSTRKYTLLRRITCIIDIRYLTGAANNNKHSLAYYARHIRKISQRGMAMTNTYQIP